MSDDQLIRDAVTSAVLRSNKPLIEELVRICVYEQLHTKTKIIQRLRHAGEDAAADWIEKDV